MTARVVTALEADEPSDRGRAAARNGTIRVKPQSLTWDRGDEPEARTGSIGLLPSKGSAAHRSGTGILPRALLPEFGPLVTNSVAPGESSMYAFSAVTSPNEKKRRLRPPVHGKAQSRIVVTRIRSDVRAHASTACSGLAAGTLNGDSHGGYRAHQPGRHLCFPGL